MQIYKFNSILKPVLWGGDKVVTFKRLPPAGEPIGESWELSAVPGRESVVINGEDLGLTLSQLVARYGADLVGEDVYQRYGERFPLLIKVIDAQRDLSVQVHPGDELARRDHGCDGNCNTAAGSGTGIMRTVPHLHTTINIYNYNDNE